MDSAAGQVVNVNVTFADMSPTAIAVPVQQARELHAQASAVPLAQRADGTFVAESGA